MVLQGVPANKDGLDELMQRFRSLLVDKLKKGLGGLFTDVNG